MSWSSPLGAALMWVVWLAPTHRFGWWPHRLLTVLVAGWAFAELVACLAPGRGLVARGVGICCLGSFALLLLGAFLRGDSIDIDGAYLVPQWLVSCLPLLVFASRDLHVLRPPRQPRAEVLAMALAVIAGCAALTIGAPALDLVGKVYGETKTSFSSDLGRMRISVPFENPNYLGLAALTVAWMSLGARAMGREDRVRVGLAMVAIVMTASRSSLVAVLVLLGLHLFGGRRSLARRIVPAAVVAALAAAMAGSEFGGRLGQVLEAPSLADLSRLDAVSGRLSAWARLWQTLSDPLQFWGTGLTNLPEDAVVDAMLPFWIVRGGVLPGLLMLLATGLCLTRVLRRDARRHLALFAVVQLMLLGGAYLVDARMAVLVAVAVASVAREEQGLTS